MGEHVPAELSSITLQGVGDGVANVGGELPPLFSLFSQGPAAMISSALVLKNSGMPLPPILESQFLLRFVTICVLMHFHMQNVSQHFSLDF